MNKELEEKIKGFKQSMEGIKRHKSTNILSPHGERILKLIEEGDYSEAKFVTRCLIECGLSQRFSEEVSQGVADYLGSAYTLAMNLPRQ